MNYELLMPCYLTVRSEMLPFAGNIQKLKMFRVPRNITAIGYVHSDNLQQGNIALQCHSKQLSARSDGCFHDDFPTLSEE